MIEFAAENVLDPQRHVLKEITLSDFGTVVQFVTSEDDRVAAAIEMEIDNMASLGDPSEEVREEFLPYQGQSTFMLAYRQGEPMIDENLQGMARLLHFSEDESDGEVRRNKTIKDLAIIDVGSHYLDEDARELMHVYEQGFIETTGVADLSKVMDVATLAVDQHANSRDIRRSAITLTTAIAQHLIDEYNKGTVDYVTSFNEVGSDKMLRNLGFPFKDLFEHGPVKYITQSNKGMIAQPSFGYVAEMQSLLLDPNSRISRRLGHIALPVKTELGESTSNRPRPNGVTRMLGLGAKLLLG
jgi:hypothetical protein